MEKTNIYEPCFFVSAFHFFLEKARCSNVTYISHRKGSCPMSLVITLIHDNAIYVAADSRYSEITPDFQQISYKDNYKKVIASKTGKFILFSTGNNQFTAEKRMVEDMVADIDNWAEKSPNCTIYDITAYANKLFQDGVNKVYKQRIKEFNHLKNTDVTLEQLKNVSVSDMGIAYFDDLGPIVVYNTYIPLAELNRFSCFSCNHQFAVWGPEDIKEVLTKYLESTCLLKENFIIKVFNDAFSFAQKKNMFIGGPIEIYKIFLKDRKPYIKRLGI